MEPLACRGQRNDHAAFICGVARAGNEHERFKTFEQRRQGAVPPLIGLKSVFTTSKRLFDSPFLVILFDSVFEEASHP